MSNRAIRVTVEKYEKVNLLVATSADLPGLVVHGRTPDEIQEKISPIVRDLLEESGFSVVSVTTRRDTVPDLSPPAFIADASLIN